MDLEFATEYLRTEHFDMVVCADSGLNTAYALHLPVDYILGDFDSVQQDVLQQYRRSSLSESVHAQFIQYPVEKDATDGEMVLSWVLTQEPDEVVILGATGGRLDHMLAMINVLIQPLKKKIPTYIIDRYNKLYLIEDKHVFNRESIYGKYISFQPLTEQVTGVTLIGMKYPLSQYTMTIGNSLGVSNEMSDDVNQAEVQIDQGILIVAETRD